MQLWVRLALFLSAFVVGTVLIAGPPAPTEPMRSSLAHLAARTDTYDLVFVGSSRVMRGVSPGVFDRVLAERGHAIRSFNFSTIGIREHEANVFMKRILADRPERLRWLIVETSDWSPTIRRGNRFSERVIFWHDRGETLAAMRSSLAIDAPLATRLDLFSTHLLHGLARLSGVGRGWSRLKPTEEPTDTVAEGRGFFPYVPAHYVHGGTAEFHRKYLARLEGETPEEPAAAAIAVPPPAHITAELTRQAAEIRAAGAEPIHLALPRLMPPGQERVPLENIPGVRVLAFDDPAIHPEFYRVENRFDAEHLSREGAEKLSRLLAEQFAERFLEN